MTISGFSFIHNALTAGYPITEAINTIKPYVDEVVMVDMASTDGTQDVLKRMGVRIINGRWEQLGDRALDTAWSHYKECIGDTILHFEADEVFDPSLLIAMVYEIERGNDNLCVQRIQVEQNFQRARWYPTWVHRVWPKEFNPVRMGHTTSFESTAMKISGADGFLWDVCNDFRDQWLARVEQQAEIHPGGVNYLMVPKHCNEPVYLTREQAIERLKEPHWEYRYSPFDLPASLRKLVGRTKYEPS
jgi:glycosyltransferase involved in cell wall biosynthesis